MSAGLLTRPDSTLAERALQLLGQAPCDSDTIAMQVLELQRAPGVVADRLVTALLGPDPRVRRLPDGRWAVNRHGGASPRIDESTFAVVDVETTGSRAAVGDRITEIAVVLLHRGTVTVALDTLVNPERAIPSVVTRITRITQADVDDQPVFGEIVDDVLVALAGRIFVAHNVRFDWNFVARSIRRARDIVLEGPQICTVRLSKKLIPGLKSRSLDSVAHYFGVDIERRHRAGGDALATARVLARLLERAEDRGLTTLQDLERLCAVQPRKKRRKRRASPTSVSEI